MLTGTASHVPVPGAAHRRGAARGLIPGTRGDVYDTAALTEDNELTIALKSLGGLMVSPDAVHCGDRADAHLVHALGTAAALAARGTGEHRRLRASRRRRLRYWAQQLGIGYGVIALGSYLLLIFLMVFSLDTWIWFPFWLGLGVLFMVERVATVWRGGWRARLLAVTLFPELFFDMFLNVVYLKGVADISLGRTASWKHVTHARPRETTGAERS